MQRRSNEQSLGDVIKEFLKAYQMEDRIMEVKIHSMWQQIMGDHIHQFTEKLYYKDKLLIVYLRSAPLREELSRAKTKIAGMINKEMKKDVVREVIFR
ncbi:MAG: DUF721 domain-containing protein [Bacteroidota bacterium]